MVKQDFTELKHCYRVRVEQFSTRKTFVSNESFDTYEDAWNYAKESTNQFSPCGFCVVECNEPELQFNIDFSSPCDGCEPNYINACSSCRFASPDINESLRYSDEG